jgi:hypothetical protein
LADALVADPPSPRLRRGRRGGVEGERAEAGAGAVDLEFADVEEGGDYLE